MPQRLRIASLCCGFLLVFSAGCTKTVIFKLARHEVGKNPVAQPAITTAVYKVKWTDRKGGDFVSLPATERLIDQGQPLGFESTGSGTVLATAGVDKFELPNLPPKARYCVWYTREEVPTQFGREMVKALDTTGKVAFYAAATALTIAIDDLANYDGDDSWPSFNQESKHHRHHKNSKPSSPTTRGTR